MLFKLKREEGILLKLCPNLFLNRMINLLLLTMWTKIKVKVKAFLMGNFYHLIQAS